MSARLIPDGAAITNHFTASFSPWVLEANATEVGALKDEIMVVDGPDKRGYITGQATRGNVPISVPQHDPATPFFHIWKEACENGVPGHNVIGVITVLTSFGIPIEIYELENCILHTLDTPDLKLDGGEVGINKWTVSYSRCKRIGP